MVCEITELRYSLNGISDSQIQTLFNQIQRDNNQFIIKRVTDPSVALSSDDILIEGKFSSEFLNVLARVFPPPLACKIQFEGNFQEKLREYAAFSWSYKNIVLLGVTVFPYVEVQSYIGFTSSTHFLNLITSTKAATLLKGLLLIKPKGLISFDKNVLTMVMPNHRIDFIIAWLNQLMVAEVNLNWLSGSTGELDEELAASVNFVNHSNLEEINSCLEKAIVIQAGELKTVFRRALASIQPV
ncbi:MAG: hypothetical protein HeimC2_10190 [Candidatus Heimdallarchaeota archaeon LC_2]|nr:MAG: hypothetical protein HeimC2_10190 [Candidatus Heimdallarchaeota archaeon LC_2]